MTWHTLAPADDEFLQQAPARTVQVIDVDVPVETLWAALVADDALVSWGPGVTAVRWLGGRPYGVGTVREVTIAGVATVRENFYRWEEGHRKSFAVTESSRPGIRRLVEDYVVTPTATGSRLTWTVGVEVSRWSGPTAVLLNPGLSLAIGSVARGLRRKLGAH